MSWMMNGDKIPETKRAPQRCESLSYQREYPTLAALSIRLRNKELTTEEYDAAFAAETERLWPVAKGPIPDHAMMPGPVLGPAVQVDKAKSRACAKGGKMAKQYPWSYVGKRNEG